LFFTSSALSTHALTPVETTPDGLASIPGWRTWL
jgi:hypothetical protein